MCDNIYRSWEKTKINEQKFCLEETTESGVWTKISIENRIFEINSSKKQDEKKQDENDHIVERLAQNHRVNTIFRGSWPCRAP